MISLKSLSTAGLRRELERRERGAKRIAVKRDKLAKEIAELDAELASLGVASTPRRGRPPGSKNKRRGRKPGRKPTRGRAKNKRSLPDALAAAVRRGTVVSPAEAAKRVKARGYKTKSKTFGISVSQALTNDKRFKRVGRGQYQRLADRGAAKPMATTGRKPRKTARRAKAKARTRTKPKTTSRESPKTRSKAKPKATKARKPRKTARRSKSKARGGNAQDKGA